MKEIQRIASQDPSPWDRGSGGRLDSECASVDGSQVKHVMDRAIAICIDNIKVVNHH